MSELPPIEQFDARIEELRTENERLRNTLVIFSDSLGWRRDGICDPNSSNFKGQRIATDALQRS